METKILLPLKAYLWNLFSATDVKEAIQKEADRLCELGGERSKIDKDWLTSTEGRTTKRRWHLLTGLLESISADEQELALSRIFYKEGAPRISEASFWNIIRLILECNVRLEGLALHPDNVGSAAAVPINQRVSLPLPFQALLLEMKDYRLTIEDPKTPNVWRRILRNRKGALNFIFYVFLLETFPFLEEEILDGKFITHIDENWTLYLEIRL